MTTRELRPVDRQEFLETIGPIQVRLGKLEAALAARSESDDTDALTEARAQGAAEERERLANLAEANEVSEDFLKPDWRAWHNFAAWLRSNTGEG